jgi:Tfp pilus assembly pilus retraction ATPase PilT
MITAAGIAEPIGVRILRGEERKRILEAGPGRVLAWEKMATSLRVRNAIRDGKVHQLRGMMQANVEELVSIDWTSRTWSWRGRSSTRRR